MERTLKASDSVAIRSVIGPIAIGFVLGFLLVGATRLQPDQQAVISADASEARSMTGDKSMLEDNSLRLPAHARFPAHATLTASAATTKSAGSKSAGTARRIIHPLF